MISYASQGDLITHFQGVPIQEVMKKESPEIQTIHTMEVAGTTCISQALETAIQLADNQEYTAISLHSDGYANDTTYQNEFDHLKRLALSVQNRPIMINTIAHSSYSNFNLLSKIANWGSGACILALDLHQVYVALHDTSRLLIDYADSSLSISKKQED